MLEKTLTPAHCLQSSAHSRSRRGAGQWLSRETTVQYQPQEGRRACCVYTALYAEGPRETETKNKEREGREDVGAAGVRSAAAGVRSAAAAGSGPSGGRGAAGLRARSGAAPGLRGAAAAAAVPAAGLPGTANTAGTATTAISTAAVAVPAAVASGTGDAAGDAGASADGCDLPCRSRGGHRGADPGPGRHPVPGRRAGRCRARNDFPRAGADEPASPGTHTQLTGPAFCAHHQAQRGLSVCMSAYPYAFR